MDDGDTLKRCEEMQEDELLVLRSIYGDDVRDMRESDVWKVRRPLELEIKLFPLHSSASDGSEAYTQAVLYVKCTQRYPYVAPTIEIREVKGISTSDASTLLEELKATPCTGEVMLFGLAQKVQTFLHLHSMPYLFSFYDQMLLRQCLLKEKEEEAQRLKEQAELRQKEMERKEIEEEILRRREVPKTARPKRDEGRKSESMSPVAAGPVVSGKDNEDAKKLQLDVSSDRCNSQRDQAVLSRKQRRTTLAMPEESRPDRPGPQCQRHVGSAVLTFNTKQQRTVHRGQCIGHGNGCVTYSAIETGTGELLAVTEWSLQFPAFGKKMDFDQHQELDNEMAKYLKQLESATQELMSLLKLSHQGLLHYLDMQYQRVEASIVVHVLREHCCGWSLDTYRRQQQPVDLPLLRKYAADLVDTLLYLHGNAVAHKSLRADAVYVDEVGDLRVADYSLFRRLNEIIASLSNQSPSAVPALPPAPGKRWQKEDIYQLGLMLLSLWTGEDICLKEVLIDKPSALPSSLPLEFRDFLFRCLLTDDRLRWAASELKEHAFLKMPLSRHTAHPVAGDSPDQPAGSPARLLRRTAHQRQGGDRHREANGSDGDDDGLNMLAQLGRGSGTLSQSRLMTEFDVLELLGTGAFGAVMKVKNKLDGRLYAIKRIPLNVKGSEHLNRKITREVKLLSRLNHENVVRYYNSWLEESTSQDVSSDSSVSLTSAAKEGAATTQRFGATTQKVGGGGTEGEDAQACNSIGLKINDDFENLVATNVAQRSVDESGSWAPQSNPHSLNSRLSVSSSPEEESVFGRCLWHLPLSGSSDSESIAFECEPHEQDSEPCLIAKQAEDKIVTSSEASEEKAPKIQYMCIQMEFCEKSTLRNSIDMGLYQDVDRVWRLFREIIEGLVHVHEQGMIHRDLKPVNIFLDSNDHVKIGDFGLATTEALARSVRTIPHGDVDPAVSAGQQLSDAAGTSLGGDTGHTGQVGTALYASPEIVTASGKTSYSQKVDIYSLGVIFFEMCYRPFSTAMQRITILSALRRPEIVLPDDFIDDRKMEQQISIVRWLLNHEASKRPTAVELLQSRLLPPPLVEEAELQEIVRSTVANPQSRGYKKLMSALFQQQVHRKSEIGYDEYLQRGLAMNVCRAQEYVKDLIIRVFRHHGALAINVPFLLPKLSVYEDNDTQVCLMDYAGGLVSLPYDLRVPFARFVARSNVAMCKRYAVERVYRETKPHGIHPRAHWECAFDVVTPAPSLLPDSAWQSSASNITDKKLAVVQPKKGLCPPAAGGSTTSQQAASLHMDAEVVYIVREVINQFPSLTDKTFVCHFNHTSLLKSVLLHCGVPSSSVDSCLRSLASVGLAGGESKMSPANRKWLLPNAVIELNLGDQAYMQLRELLSISGPFGLVSCKLKKITKTRGEAGSLAKRGLHELEVLLNYVQSLGLKMELSVSLSMTYGAQYSSGFMFQVMATGINYKHRGHVEVLAAGCRYDSLIAAFRLPWNSTSCPGGVGVSIAFEHIVSSVLAQKEFILPGNIDVLLCAIGKKSYVVERLTLARDLWAANVKADVYCDDFAQDLEDVQKHCKEEHIGYLVIFKDTEQPGYVKVKSFDKDKVSERRLLTQEVVDYVGQSLSKSESHSETPSTTASKPSQPLLLSAGDLQQQQQQQGPSSYSSGTATLASIVYLPYDDKLVLKDKRKAEAQVASRLQGSGVPLALVTLSRSSQLHVVAAELTADVVRTVASFAEVSGTEQAFQDSLAEVISRHKRHKKYLERIFDKIHDLKFVRKNCAVVVYGLKDDCYRLLL